MIVVRTPMRVSLFGGGTDLPDFYQRSPGRVLGGAIDKYLYLVVKDRFDGRTRASWSTTEVVDDPSQLKHDIARTILTRAHVGGVDVASFSDAPPDGSGLGSSSAFAVGLTKAVYARAGTECADVELAEEAAKIEIDKLQKPIGKQDHYFAACGGFREFTFRADGTVQQYEHQLGSFPIVELCDRLLLFYTGISRQATPILREQNQNSLQSPETFATLQRMAEQADEASRLLYHGRFEEVGRMLDEAWRMKRTLASGISNPQIDRWYDLAKEAGALGGKLLGAGGGGFLLFYVPKGRHHDVQEALSDLRRIPFDWEREGCKVVYRSAESSTGGGRA